MAPLANEVNAAADAAGLDSRQNDGISLAGFQVRRNHPTYIVFKWCYRGRSPIKFTVWFRNVRAGVHYNADADVKASSGGCTSIRVGLSSLHHKPGKYQIVITKYNDYRDVYARSRTFNIYNSDF